MLVWMVALDWVKLALYSRLRKGPGRPRWYQRFLKGRDAAGKDATINHVLSAMNPQGCTVTGFKVPSKEEAAHDFLWRYHQHTPAKGQVAIFNRQEGIGGERGNGEGQER